LEIETRTSKDLRSKQCPKIGASNAVEVKSVIICADFQLTKLRKSVGNTANTRTEKYIKISHDHTVKQYCDIHELEMISGSLLCRVSDR